MTFSNSANPNIWHFRQSKFHIWGWRRFAPKIEHSDKSQRVDIMRQLGRKQAHLPKNVAEIRFLQKNSRKVSTSHLQQQYYSVSRRLQLVGLKQSFAFNGSNLLQDSLPMLVVLEEMLDTAVSSHQQTLAELLAYCHLDTLAMVETHQVLHQFG